MGRRFAESGAVPDRRGRGGGRPDWLTATAVLGALLLAYYAVPVAALVVSRSPGAVLASLTRPAVAAAAVTSVLAATASTAVSTVLGVPLAYWLARLHGPAATALTAVVAFPLVLPPVVAGMVLLTVVGPGTAAGSAAAAAGVPLTGSFAGVVLAQTFVASPFVVVTTRAAFEGVDPDLERAARSLGEGRLATVRRVTLPLAWPGVLAGVTLAFARSLGEFGATLMVAYYPRTLPVQVWTAFQTRGLSAAFPAAVVLLCVAAVSVLAVHALGYRVGGHGRGRNADRHDRDGPR